MSASSGLLAAGTTNNEHPELISNFYSTGNPLLENGLLLLKLASKELGVDLVDFGEALSKEPNLPKRLSLPTLLKLESL
ncbi:hypothetical protein BpHYR1_027513 [Brachionus plicatilis]|uniref:Uncharacterized protein n=1 Tax=Brachionus plicatilis TaxID=10195 RepID=A0A3M7RYR5_BRAPC|nr:hypothetical protein BpHYR1_027513 [Brachionus plicatilis]